VSNSLVQGQAAAASPPVCLLAGNSWKQGQIALAKSHCFFSFLSFFVSFNSLLTGSVKLKKKMQRMAEICKHLGVLGHRTSNCCPPVQISLCLSVSATLPTIMQCRELQKESCCKHLGRTEPAKYKETHYLYLPPACTAL
jgi:hypothetical protein